ncbi:hypothetical protein J4229_02765 [Candidatus Pacearchaeota archaeon]|nr:hypothetical protein [Candidatus Pacearchaeota archaeon]
MDKLEESLRLVKIMHENAEEQIKKIMEYHEENIKGFISDVTASLKDEFRKVLDEISPIKSRYSNGCMLIVSKFSINYDFRSNYLSIKIDEVKRTDGRVIARDNFIGLGHLKDAKIMRLLEKYKVGLDV